MACDEMRTRTALILLQLDILCTSAVKPHYPKKLQFAAHMSAVFFRASEFVEANKP